MFDKKKQKSLLFYVLFLIIGILIGYSLSFNKKGALFSHEIRSGGYKLINPLYECSPDETIGGKQFGSLENKILDLINNYKSLKHVSNVSVYFRDLNDGPWFGINEKDSFSPSSLLKLPIAITFYKISEKDPTILKKKIKYTSTPNNQLPQYYKPKNVLTVNNEYSVEELIKAMLINSDNVALGLLKQKEIISSKELERIYSDLDIPSTKDKNGTSEYMRIKEYSSLFRVLYNASYLNKDNSEKLLQLLSEVDFSDGIRKPIPTNITVANKFGERYFSGDLFSPYQLHDCGIIYYPDHPYLICIMTQGTDFQTLTNVIQKISKEVYDEVNSRYKKI